LAKLGKWLGDLLATTLIPSAGLMTGRNYGVPQFGVVSGLQGLDVPSLAHDVSDDHWTWITGAGSAVFGGDIGLLSPLYLGLGMPVFGIAGIAKDNAGERLRDWYRRRAADHSFMEGWP
jgi:hypothetical protein